MEWSLLFVLNSILLGVGLAMDAFSVSLANGLNEPFMRKKNLSVQLLSQRRHLLLVMRVLSLEKNLEQNFSRQSRYFRRRNLDFYRTGNFFERSFFKF